MAIHELDAGPVYLQSMLLLAQDLSGWQDNSSIRMSTCECLSHPPQAHPTITSKLHHQFISHNLPILINHVRYLVATTHCLSNLEPHLCKLWLVISARVHVEIEKFETDGETVVENREKCALVR